MGRLFLSKKDLTICYSDGEVYKLPIDLIAKDRAEYYFRKTKSYSSVDESLKEDTLPLFEKSPDEIIYWVNTHMRMDNVYKHSIRFASTGNNFDQEWVYEDGKFPEGSVYFPE